MEEKKYTESDLVNFGKYLLSKERDMRLHAGKPADTYRQQRREVHHADLENWKHLQSTIKNN